MKDTNNTINNLLKDFVFKIKSKQKLLQIINNTIKFNRKLVWYTDEKNIFLATTAEALIEIYKLRSQVYSKLNYNKEFPDTINGLNFDLYDEYSAIIYTKSKGRITGTCRVIFDSHQKLPMDKNFSLDYLRCKNKKLAELSRLMIESETKGLSQEPKLLTKGAYLVMNKNTRTTLMSVMVEEHFKLYDKFGGFSIENKLQSYGSLGIPFIITSWEIAEVSSFFKRAFLSA